MQKLITQREKSPLLHDQSLKSVRFVIDVALNNEISGRREGYSAFKHKTREREYSAEEAAVFLSDLKVEAEVRR
jgi:hypothetical protein